MSTTGDFNVSLLCLQVEIYNMFFLLCLQLETWNFYTLFTVEDVPPPFVYKWKVGKAEEGLGGPTCEDPGPGHLEGVSKLSSPRPKLHPGLIADPEGLRVSILLPRGCRAGGLVQTPAPLPRPHAVSKEIKNSASLTGAKSHQPGPHLRSPQGRQPSKRRVASSLVLGSVDAPLRGSPHSGPASPLPAV